ncbi:MAG: Nif3-like dinuclear metal center hexameric protein [Coriobacteriia bacterium]|nr:Nif3-like dinuclear metal center hexameric protein [Coriobacteriia bacterium]
MGSPMTRVTVGDVERAVVRAFPADRAEGWDRIGLLAGDPLAEVTGVVLALDPSPEAIDEAHRRGANVLVTHHPAFLDPVAPVRGAPGGGGTVFRALSKGVSLINAHTNLDRDPGAQRLIPSLLGLTPVAPIERSAQPCAVVTVYVPLKSADEVADAMSGAGGGAVGRYQACSFSCTGIGRFTADDGADPAVGVAGQPTNVEEVRLEMITSRPLSVRVVAAARASHPYEEPLITVTEVLRSRNASALGMLCEASEGFTLADLVGRAAAAFCVKPRVWGEASSPIGRVACATGSAGSLIHDAIAAGATALVAGEVRYHDATEALERGLAVVEIGHDVSEWPLVGLLAQVVRGVAGIEPDRIYEMNASTAWWTP